MNDLESQLDYPLGDTLPETGHTITLAPGVRWLRMALPFALNHINLWLLEDNVDSGHGPVRGWTVIDCGIASDDIRAAWETIFGNELDGLPVLRVLATHCHPDHVGLAHWICERWNAPLWMTAAEYAFARAMSAGLAGTGGEASEQHFLRHGMHDGAMQEKVAGRKGYYPAMVPAMPASYVRMQDGDKVAIGGRDWRVITGFGHSPEHAALYSDDLNVLISGDMILPRISTNVSVMAIEPEADPVRQYLQSLKKYADLPPDTLVLPSHGKPFRGLPIRITQLNDHHRDRLAEVLEACITPLCAADIVPLMFRRPLDSHQMVFALGEALAHLHQLWFTGALVRRLDADGVFRFVRSEQ
jgi:glyoxylase-like metal-dependent hydrolase (beta-lactamase superfamily II)